MNKIFLFIFAVLLSVSSIAFDKQLDLENRLNHLKNIFLEFKQKIIDKDGKQIFDAQGKLWIKDKTTFYIHIDSPSPVKVISNGKTVWHFNIKDRSVTVLPFEHMKKNVQILSMLNDPSFLKAIVNKHKNNAFNMILSEKFLPYKKININITEEGIIKRAEFIDDTGERIIFEFRSQNKWDVEPDKFNFVIPERTEVNDLRLSNSSNS
ncbi:outer membrane lipoprotein chaperone LolA [Buchnera aphidicola]|uniref:Outer-membrane lipoprotein carrier protein n=1 Tax=Buchnera aphidicola (Anoecia oenotherae) TaxID=1241833 RepID=A0A4D6XPW7_9GAMM|nr:outer membrane lipoprotein chaperone LolA [Buchnera aphidicola]QCI19372.1 outer membrane lipoprotein carrier protein LolA [Buchnera aphidicola (Anoecia oenotherae)]